MCECDVDLESAVYRLVWTFRGIRRLDSIRLDRVSPDLSVLQRKWMDFGANLGEL